MAVRPIRVFGDPVLRKRCSEVVDFDRSLRKLVKDLIDTLDDADGAGLAAPQIGVDLRVFAYVVTDPEADGYAVMHHVVNPMIVEQSDDALVDVEGCLSIPGLEYELARAARVVAEGRDMHGEPVRIVGTERLARCLAHETDHLDGVLFLDRLEPEARKRAMREVRERILAGEDLVVKRSPHPGLG